MTILRKTQQISSNLKKLYVILSDTEQKQTRSNPNATTTNFRAVRVAIIRSVWQGK